MLPLSGPLGPVIVALVGSEILREIIKAALIVVIRKKL
jgi:hypothetical protein